MKILMCRPNYYGIEYEINPWMNVKLPVNHQLAQEQWNTLYHTLIECGADIQLLTPVSGLPDMVFTANAGLFYQQKIILSSFKHKERQGEEPHFQAWFKQAGFEVVNLAALSSRPYFEGAGDALLAGETLFAGYGYRTERRFYEEAAYLDPHKLVYCELNNPYFYHLDTCFCPLNEQLAMVYLDAFTEDTQKNLANHIELLPVLEEEAKRFACNAVVVNQHVILSTHCPHIETALEKRGFTVHRCEMSEYLKAGGACKCLTLRLDESC